MTFQNQNLPQRHKHLVQLITLLIVFAAYPLVQGRAVGRIFLDAMLTAILIAAVSSFSVRPRYFKPSLALAIVALLTLWLARHVDSEADAVSPALLAVFFLFVIAASLTSLLRGRDVTAETVFQSLNIFLFIGMFFAMVFAGLEMSSPGSLSIPEKELAREGNEWFALTFYYSFVNLTTVGFGDVTPLTPFARSLSIIEAILGQFYLTVLVARLVGLHIAQHGSTDASES